MAVEPFEYDAVPGRVVFGSGRRRTLPDEIDAIGSRRIVMVASRRDAELVDELTDRLGGRVVGHFDDIAQHVPVAKATVGTTMVRELGADTVVTVGGGSAIGFGKVIALETDVRQVAIPTTYAGSEMTTIWGRTEDGHKRTGKDPRVKPAVVIYDPELTLSLPPAVAGPSGMNALAHCVEALYGPGANPVISAVAVEGMRALYDALPRVCGHPDDLDARTDALYGAYLAGVALATGGTALHHKTCHVLGGMFDLNHGDMNAVVLGHALAYNAPAIPEQLARMADALGTPDVPGALHDLAHRIGAPTSLAEIGMPEAGIAPAAPRVVEEASANVRPPDVDGITAMLRAAHAGTRPDAVEPR
jgi:maleylacetate reductase